MSSSHETIVLNDLDRCLYDTEKGFNGIVRVIDTVTPITEEEIRTYYAELKSQKKSFNVVGWVEKELQTRKIKKSWERDIMPTFIDYGRSHDMLMPYAREYLDTIDELGLDSMLLTYGSWSNEVADPGLDRERSVKWQLGKIASSDALAYRPSLVIGTPHKARLISDEWAVKDISGQTNIILPPEVSDFFEQTHARAILTDDKTVAFNGIDLNVMDGIHVTPENLENRTAHLEGNLDPGVVAVTGLRQAIDVIPELVYKPRAIVIP